MVSPLFQIVDASTLRLLLPEFCLLGGALAALVWAMVAGRRGAGALPLGAVAALAAFLTCFDSWNMVAQAPTLLFDVPHAAAPGTLVADRFLVSVKALIAALALSMIGLRASLERPRAGGDSEFVLLLHCSAVGMMLMIGSQHLIVLAIAVELASIPSYILVALDRRRRTASEAALKYALFGAACSGLSLYGASLLFGLYGSLHLPEIAARMAIDPGGSVLVAAALLMALAGVGFKIALMPLHFWCPDAFEGATLSVAAWLSTASKIAGLIVLVRVLSMLSTAGALDAAPGDLVRIALVMLATITFTAANLAAFVQRSARRLMAYSSIAHAGYIAAIAAVLPRDAAELQAVHGAALAYVAVYAVMNVGAFTALGLIADDRGDELVQSFRGLGWRDPVTAAGFSICLISLIGLPPLGGFVVKWWSLYALGAGASAAPLLWLVALAIVLNTALSVYYYFRLIAIMYLSEPDEARRVSSPLAGRLLVCGCAAALVLAGTFWLAPLKRFTDTAVQPAPAQPTFSSSTKLP